MAETIAIALLTSVGVTAVAGSAIVTVTGAIIGLGISVGVSALAQAFTRPDKTAAEGAAPADRQFVAKSPIAARVRSYGRVRIAGAQMFLNTSGGGLYRVVAHNAGLVDAVVERLINDVAVEIDGDGWVTTAPWAGHVRWLNRLGTTTQPHYSSLEAAFPEWDDTHTGKGIASSLVIFNQVEQGDFLTVYPGGETTTIKITLDASQVWDPRDEAQDPDDPATWTWSDNAALVILDYLRHESGFAMPLVWLEPELDVWIAAADICDEAVDLAEGGTVARYRIWGSYGFDERPADVLARMLTACNGRIWTGPNGGIILNVGAWETPTVTIGDDAILSYRLGAGNEAPDTANTITAVYLDADQGYTETEAEPWADEAAVTAYGEIVADAKLYLVPGHSQCRRLQKQALARIAPEWTGSLTTNLGGLAALSERFITIEIGELGLSFTAEIDDATFVIQDGNVVTGLTINFTAMASAAFAWDANTEEGTPAEVPPSIVGEGIPPPINFRVSVTSVPTALVQWDAAAEGVTTRVEYKLAADSEWTIVTDVEGTSLALTLVEDETYEFRARSIGLSRWSAYSSTITATIAVDGTAPGVPTSLSISSIGIEGDVTVYWTQPADANTAGANVYRHTSNDAGSATLVGTTGGGPSAAKSFVDVGPFGPNTYYWWVAAINGSAVEGTRTAAGSISYLYDQPAP